MPARLANKVRGTTARRGRYTPRTIVRTEMTMPDDPAAHNDPATPPSTPPLPASDTPAPTPGPTPTPAPAPESRPILEIQEDLCPKCGLPLRPGEVVCIKCGFDMRTSAVHEPRLGVEHVDDIPAAPSQSHASHPSPASSPAGTSVTTTSASTRAKRWIHDIGSAALSGDPRRSQEEFSVPGRGSIRTLLIFAAALAASAMVIAGIDSYGITGRLLPTAGRVVLTLYITLLATGLGLAAVAVVARISDMRLGRPDLATARILLAFTAFQALRGITFPGPPLLVHLLMWCVGIAAYWGLVMLLFKKPRHIAGYVLVTHFVLYLALVGGMELAGWVSGAEHTAPAAKSLAPSNTDTLGAP